MPEFGRWRPFHSHFSFSMQSLADFGEVACRKSATFEVLMLSAVLVTLRPNVLHLGIISSSAHILFDCLFSVFTYEQ